MLFTQHVKCQSVLYHQPFSLRYATLIMKFPNNRTIRTINGDQRGLRKRSDQGRALLITLLSEKSVRSCKQTGSCLVDAEKSGNKSPSGFGGKWSHCHSCDDVTAEP